MSESSQPRPTKPRWILTLGVTFALLALWPLSMGPLVWMQQHDIIETVTYNQICKTIYAPWMWLYETDEAVERFFHWYTDLWDGR